MIKLLELCCLSVKYKILFLFRCIDYSNNECN